MAQRGFDRVLFCFAREVVGARTKISGGQDRTRRDFPFKTEIVLQRVRELRMVSRLNNVYGLR